MATESLDEIRRRAALARRLAKGAADQKARKSLYDLAAELEKKAQDIHKSATACRTHAEIAHQNAAETGETTRQIRARLERVRKPPKP